uniref:Uncharacterized protein n=1 Tax=Arundo donax TaxID=35708 RepID=A0A0A9FCC2_ARUDO
MERVIRLGGDSGGMTMLVRCEGSASSALAWGVGVESGGDLGLGSAAAIKASTGPCWSSWCPPGAGACSWGGGSGGRGRLDLGLGLGLGSGVEEEEEDVGLRVRDERRVRPRGADEQERAAWEATAKANSRLRPARTPERRTKEPPPLPASSSMRSSLMAPPWYSLALKSPPLPSSSKLPLESEIDEGRRR